jgi:hypothetical protein
MSKIEENFVKFDEKPFLPYKSYVGKSDIYKKPIVSVDVNAELMIDVAALYKIDIDKKVKEFINEITKIAEDYQKDVDDRRSENDDVR